MAEAFDDLAFAPPLSAPSRPLVGELFCRDCDEIATQTTPGAQVAMERVREGPHDRTAAAAAVSYQHNAEGVLPEPENASAHDVERLMQLLMESLGEGFGGANDARRPAADSAVARLGSFIADQASTIEVAIAVSGIGGEVVAIPANFGPCESLPRAHLCLADPLDGSQEFSNAKSIQGNIVVMERGTCTFAQKILRAQASGAIGVIIVQTFDVWPYTMTDSKGESASITIPAFMLSMKQGKRFLAFLRDHEAQSTEPPPSAEITVRKNERECVICQVEMSIGVKLTRMPCQHMFHTDCLHQWLKIGNSCPICRVEIPSKNGSSSSTSAQDLQRTAAWSAWFS